MEIQPSVLFEVIGGVGWVKLNRPRALNALTVDMVEIMERMLIEWKQDQSVALICIVGEGDKGLCAGGDMRALYDRRDSDVETLAYSFFTTEYRMDMMIHHYPKPILCYMNGIVMGGGVGISIGAKYRIVTEKTKWAMPEMNIGFFPDVGASYFLSRMPGHIGRYLALSSEIIQASDILYIRAADRYFESSQCENLTRSIKEREWSIGSAESQLQDVMDQFTQTPLSEPPLALLQKKIDTHFAFSTVEEILLSLDYAAERGDTWADTTASVLRSKSPTALKVTLRQMLQGSEKSLLDCFRMELLLSMNFMRNHDFYEGVRAVLVDKDRSPKWNPASLETVSEEQVSTFFESPWGTHESPLDNLYEIKGG